MKKLLIRCFVIPFTLTVAVVAGAATGDWVTRTAPSCKALTGPEASCFATCAAAVTDLWPGTNAEMRDIIVKRRGAQIQGCVVGVETLTPAQACAQASDCESIE